MRQCPVCGQNIDANFGMIQCSKCQTVLFIDFAGQVVSATGSNDDPSEPVVETLEPSEILENVEFPEEAPPEEIELNKHEYSEVRVDFNAPEESLPQEEFVAEPLTETPAFEEMVFPDAVETPESNSEFSSENQTSSERNLSLSSGPLFYKIKINGIDTASLRKSVLDSLQDSRLGLVRDEVSGNIDQGQLIISRLNPVKASAIMNALKELSLEVDWEMYDQETNNSPSTAE